MNKTATSYNPYNLEANFKKYLISNNFSRTSINNYVNDVRTFLNWFSHTLRSEHLELDLIHFNNSLLNKYLNYLRSSNSAVQSINRSLSSLRTFSKFLLHEEYIRENPLDLIGNIKESSTDKSFFWMKTHMKPIIAFILGFILVSFLFFLPGIVSSALDQFNNQNNRLLRDVEPIDTDLSHLPGGSTSGGILTIPMIDENGNLNLSAPYPKIIGHNGTLSLQAPELKLETLSKGTIKLETQDGSIHFVFGGEKPNLPFESAFYFSGENLSSGALIYGEVDRESDRVSLLQLSSGSPTESKFRVDSEGNLYVKGNIVLEGNLIVNPESTIFGTFSNQTATSSASR